MSAGHNSDLRDSREYRQQQVWGEQIYTRQSSRRFMNHDSVETRLTEASSIVSLVSLTLHTVPAVQVRILTK